MVEENIAKRHSGLNWLNILISFVIERQAKAGLHRLNRAADTLRLPISQPFKRLQLSP
jgi:hypothetical protein